jgi:Transglycosylase-like domain
MRNRIAAAALGVALLGMPAAAQSKDENKEALAGYEEAVRHALKHGDYEKYEQDYLRAYDEYSDAFGVEAAGRNIVLFGEFTDKGEKPAAKAEVTKDTAMFEASLAAPAETTVPAESTTTTSTYSSGTSSSTVACESGGDYAANTGNGYYGGYQFDSGTWDAYGDPAYAEASDAPPAAQDAAAASVPYDAWPNC